MAITREVKTIYWQSDDGAGGSGALRPDMTISEMEEELDIVIPEDDVFSRQIASEANAAAIPGWATWTEAEAGAWFDERIQLLLDAVPDVDGLTAEQYRNNAQAIDAQWQDVLVAQAQTIKALGRMVIALRNNTWPHLEGSE